MRHLGPNERASRPGDKIHHRRIAAPAKNTNQTESKMRDTAPTGASTTGSSNAAAMGTVGGGRGVVAQGQPCTQVQQVVEQPQQQQQQANTLPLEVWLVNILPLTPLRDLLPLCSTSKWLGDELKHDVVIKAALARRGHGKKVQECELICRLCYLSTHMHFVTFIYLHSSCGPIPSCQSARCN